MFKYCCWRILLEFRWNNAIYLLLFFYVINFVMILHWLQSFQVKSSFYNMIEPGFLYNICSDFFIYKYVWINIFIIITFLHRGSVFPLSLMSKTYDVNKSTHDVSVLMAITQVFHAPIFWSFNQRDALQRVCIILQLNSLNSYSSYKSLHFCR